MFHDVSLIMKTRPFCPQTPTHSHTYTHREIHHPRRVYRSVDMAGAAWTKSYQHTCRHPSKSANWTTHASIHTIIAYTRGCATYHQILLKSHQSKYVNTVGQCGQELGGNTAKQSKFIENLAQNSDWSWSCLNNNTPSLSLHRRPKRLARG